MPRSTSAMGLADGLEVCTLNANHTECGKEGKKKQAALSKKVVVGEAVGCGSFEFSYV